MRPSRKLSSCLSEIVTVNPFFHCTFVIPVPRNGTFDWGLVITLLFDSFPAEVPQSSTNFSDEEGSDGEASCNLTDDRGIARLLLEFYMPTDWGCFLYQVRGFSSLC